ncbi:MAG: hypothetical protein AB1696_21735 [Planctomycetota bacterium]
MPDNGRDHCEADLSRFRGAGAFGGAYEFMLEHDAHAPGSVDCELTRGMIRLCPETVGYLYGPFTPLHAPYIRGTRQKLESVLSGLARKGGGTENILTSIVEFTRRLGDRAEQDLQKMRIGGTEEEIIERGSDWCTDVARVACVLCQIAGFPCRIANLFDLHRAYSGHVIVEAHRAGSWGALDSSTGVVYLKAGGQPASVWDLMNDAELVRTHGSDPRAFYTTVDQFRAAGLANYFSWEQGRYQYPVSGLNDYYVSILEMSNKGWPGGLRWLHGEDKKAATSTLVGP